MNPDQKEPEKKDLKNKPDEKSGEQEPPLRNKRLMGQDEENNNINNFMN